MTIKIEKKMSQIGYGKSSFFSCSQNKSENWVKLNWNSSAKLNKKSWVKLNWNNWVEPEKVVIICEVCVESEWVIEPNWMVKSESNWIGNNYSNWWINLSLIINGKFNGCILSIIKLTNWVKFNWKCWSKLSWKCWVKLNRNIWVEK